MKAHKGSSGIALLFHLGATWDGWLTAHLGPFNTVLVLISTTVQSPSWDANSSSASQEIPHILWNPKVHHCAHNSPPRESTLRPMIPAHTLPSYFLRSISILFFHLHVGI